MRKSDSRAAEFGGYDPEGERPLEAYMALTAVFASAVAAGWGALARAGRRPQPPSARRAMRLGVATHKLARLIAKDKVTSPYRAPFARFESDEDAGPAEVAERPRGSGLRYALGELVGCPYCLAPWIAAGLLLGEAARPREVGVMVGALEAITVADFLQIAYKGAEEKLL